MNAHDLCQCDAPALRRAGQRTDVLPGGAEYTRFHFDCAACQRRVGSILRVHSTTVAGSQLPEPSLEWAS